MTLGAALGCGLVAGVFFAFSTFVMPALARLPATQGIAAMQAINVAAINWPFMTVLFGTGAACLVLAARALGAWHEPGAGRLLAGSLLYVLGTDLVTIAFHVPRNDALAKVHPASSEGARVWASYVPSWTMGNHVRAAAAFAAALLLASAR